MLTGQDVKGAVSKMEARTKDKALSINIHARRWARQSMKIPLNPPFGKGGIQGGFHIEGRQTTFQPMERFKYMILLSENGSGCSTKLCGVYL